MAVHIIRSAQLKIVKHELYLLTDLLIKLDTLIPFEGCFDEASSPLINGYSVSLTILY